ncbi:hypothetical protein [Streptomyces sedi]|uniref:hypothetical protein n=1 Tax=Streptomyces sedi TaxID=555059 RepID=UPI001476B562|nr:hypothetical protein [Streptomyces sedi]
MSPELAAVAERPGTRPQPEMPVRLTEENACWSGPASLFQAREQQPAEPHIVRGVD